MDCKKELEDIYNLIEDRLQNEILEIDEYDFLVKLEDKLDNIIDNL